jgi:TP901 family phage tail tape measure protein
MAKKLRDEDLVLNIIINGDKGRKEMNELERAITDTNREINKLKKSQIDLTAQGKKDTEGYKAVTAAIKQKQDAIVLAESRLSQLRSGMKLTQMSLNDLAKEQTKLNKLWKMSDPGTENLIKYREQLDAVKAEIATRNGVAEKTGLDTEAMADSFNHYVGIITAGVLGFTGVVTGLMKINETFAEFTDKVADVQKTTGLAKEEVLELNEELKRIDTRTQQEDLLGLAQVAGKLGIDGKEDVLGFVRAADQISVALTEDLGGDIEESINQIGKLVEIFNLKEEFGIEKSFLKVGSTINDLGAASSANEGFLVDFAKRVAGVAVAAGFTATKVFGLGATLDQLGQTAEVSGTTFNDIIPAMFTDTATFAAAAGMKLEDFTKLLKEDANEALLKVLEGIKGNNIGFGEMVNRLNALGIDGTRSVNVLTALAGKTQLLRDQQALANASFEKGTSLTNEYNIKNSTAAANLDRAKKAIYNMTVELGEKLNPVMTGSTSLFVIMIKLLSTLVTFFIEYRVVIATLTAAYVGYNASIALSNLFTKEGVALSKVEIALSKLKVFWTNSVTASQHLLGAAMLIVRGEAKAAAAEMALFNTVVGLNPIALFIALIAAAATALYMYSGQLNSAQKAQLAMIDVEADAQKSMVEQRIHIERLITVARDKTKSDEERAAAIKQLNALSPEYLGFLNLENITTDKATQATNNYIEALLKSARVKAAEAKMIELESKKIDLALKPRDTTWLQKGLSAVKGGLGFGTIVASETAYATQNFVEASKDIKAEQDALTAYIEKNQPKAPSSNSAGGGSTGETLSADQLKARQKYALEAKSQIDQENVAHNARLIEVGLFGKKREAMTAEDLKILQDLEKIHQDKLASINNKANKKSNTDLEKAKKEAAEVLKQQKAYQTEVITSQKTEVEQENIAHLARLQKAGINENNVKKDQVLAFEALEKIHKANLNKLDAEAITKHLDTLQKQYDKDVSALKIKNNEELASITTLEQAKLLLKDSLSQQELDKIRSFEDAKKALQDKYQQDENKLTEKQLTDLTNLLKTALDSGDFSDIHLSDKIFSPEELAILSDRLGVAKEKLAEIIAAKKTPGDSDKGDPKSKEYSFAKGKSDILGLSAEDWGLFLTNIDAGKLGIGEMVVAVEALASAWSIYSEFVSNSENRELKKYESSSNKKKDILSQQLNSGRISQEQYNSQVKRIDEDLDKKKEDIEVKQAKRQKISALLNIASSTAQAIMSIWAQVPKFDFGISAGVLTGIVAALGAAQAAVVLGKEEGGFIDVVREQDNKKFKAKNDPKKRGFVSGTSVIVSEKGTEFVATAEATANPNIRPVLDMIDTAQKNGSISSLNLESIMSNYPMQRSIQGRESGGYINQDNQRTVNSSPSTDPAILQLLKQSLEINTQLNNTLKKPIKADVSLLGKTGLIAKQDELKKIQTSANL